MNLLFSYNWIKEYAQIKDSANNLAKKLSLSGPSVERVIKIEPQFKGVIVAQILEIKKHPNADKLQLALVDTGKEKLEVVCGAPNIKEGQKVPLALVGAELAAGFKIEKRKVRGIESKGMLCAPDELGIGDDHAGILILPDDFKVGRDLAKALDWEDYLFDTEITTNRPDSMSIIGMAREASAITGAKFTYKEPATNLKAKKEVNLSIKNQATKLCYRYNGIAIDGIKVRVSPWWMQKKLIMAGIRPINNIVDITNYVLLEYGQPLHAFDYKKLKDGTITIRMAKEGENILALDGKTYKLNSKNLVIADSANPVAIAGVMGGEESAVKAETETIVIESANFDAFSIRKTSRALNLYSDSSYRFEKGLSTESTVPALKRAVELILKIAGGEIASKLIDERAKKFVKTYAKLNINNVERFLGVKIAPAQIIKILISLGFKCKRAGLIITAEVPYWRQGDIEMEQDLIEEIARIYGYHNLPTKLPVGELPYREINKELFWETKAKDILQAAGLTEIYSYSFVSAKILEDTLISPHRCIKLLNPLSEEFEYMRISLLPSMLKIAAENQEIKDEFKLFEISKVYLSEDKNKLPKEPLRLCGALVEEKGGDQLFYKAKGILELLFKKMGIKDFKFNLLEAGSLVWKIGRTAHIEINNQGIGQIGEISDKILNNFGIKKKIIVFNLDFERLVKSANTNKVYKPIPKFPSIDLDLSMIVKNNILWGNIKKAILNLGNELIREVKLFDVYKGKGIEQGKKSLAFRTIYRADSRTLKLKEAETVQDKLIKLLEKKFGAKFRR